MTRPTHVQCESCSMTMVQHPVGGLRRFCDSCRVWKEKVRKARWRAENPERHRELNRESARRRRRNGRLT